MSPETGVEIRKAHSLRFHKDSYTKEVTCAFSNKSHMTVAIMATVQSRTLRFPFIWGPDRRAGLQQKQIKIASPAGLEISNAECGVAFQSTGWQSKGQLPHLEEWKACSKSQIDMPLDNIFQAWKWGFSVAVFCTGIFNALVNTRALWQRVRYEADED